MACFEWVHLARSASRLQAVLFAASIAAAAINFAGRALACDAQTPLQTLHYRTLPSSANVEAFINRCSNGSNVARFRRFGLSATGRPLVALFLSADKGFLNSGISTADRLTILMVAGQHGTEPSGAEALQVLARNIGMGPLQRLLKTLNIVIVPLSNPDGRDLNARVNGQGINLSTDFVSISQPETLALVQLLRRLKPHVVLDVHESAILKKSSLGAQGYLTDLEAQFEISNNPNIDLRLRAFALQKFLPQVLRAVNGKGLRASRYVNEITSIYQTITHGGATLRNFRNYAGLHGALSILLENRLDPPGDYATPRNIRERVRKQIVAVSTFLEIIDSNRVAIRAVTEQSRRAMVKNPDPPHLALRFAYHRTPPDAHINIRLTRRDNGHVEVRRFDYARDIRVELSLPMPSKLFVRSEHEAVRAVLQRHGIAFANLTHPQVVEGRGLWIDNAGFVARGEGKIGSVLRVEAKPVTSKFQLKAGAVSVDTSQPYGVLALLLLDPRSSNSIYADAKYRDLLKSGTEHFLVTVP